MMAAAAALESAGSPSKEELTVSSAAQPRRGASAGTNSTLLHDSALRTATAANTPNTPTSVAASLHSSISTPTGTKLAVTTPSESPAGGEGAGITLDEEKKIALSQLQELEVAIKVRKVTKVDGRKIRWIEYRARKRAEEEKQALLTKKKTRRSKSKSKGENSENDANAVNNNNNNSKSETTMKVEMASSPLSVVGTSNVLESMKQQFLQGTDTISNGKSTVLTETVSTQRRKSGRTRKSVGTPEVESPNSTSPEKPNVTEASIKGTNIKTTNVLLVVSTSESDTSLSLPSAPVTPDISDHPLGIGIKKNYFSPRSLTKGLREVRKSENGTDGAASPPKTENNKATSASPVNSLLTISTVVADDNADGKTTVEATSETSDMETPTTNTVLESKTADSKDTKITTTELRISAESKTPEVKTTFSLVKAAAKLLSPPSAARAKSADNAGKGKKAPAQKKGNTKKSPAKSGGRSVSEPRKTVNGFSEVLHNGSPAAPVSSKSETPSSNKMSSYPESPISSPVEPENVLKRPRGRPPKRKAETKKEPTTTSPGKSGKKLSTVVVDVHNTMNGEPQTVIPVNRPVLRGKRASPTKKKALQASFTAASTGITDPQEGKDKSLPAKQQKKEAKVKRDDEVVSVNDVVPDTKKGKASAKKRKKEAVQEDRKNNENASASTLNQIQVSPEKTQSTKVMKGVQKPTHKKVPSVSVPVNSTATTPSLPTKKKPKSSRKPRIPKAKPETSGKLKAAQAKKVSPDKIVRAGKGKTVPKAVQRDTSSPNASLEVSQTKEVSEQNSSDTLKVTEGNESLQNSSLKVDSLVQSDLQQDESLLKANNLDESDLQKDDCSLVLQLSPEKEYFTAKDEDEDVEEEKAVTNDKQMSEVIDVPEETMAAKIISNAIANSTFSSNIVLSDADEKVNLSNNNSLTHSEAKASLCNDTGLPEIHSQNNNDPLINDKVISNDDKLEEREKSSKTRKVPEDKLAVSPSSNTKRKVPGDRLTESPSSKTRKVPEVKLAESPSSKTRKAPEIKLAESPSSKTRKAPEIKLAESPSSKTRKVQEVKLAESPSSKTRNVPEIKLAESPSSKTRKGQEVKLAELPSSKARKVPEVKLAESPSSKTRKAPDVKLAESPSSETIKVPEDKLAESPSSQTKKVPEYKLAESPSPETRKAPGDELAQSPSSRSVTCEAKEEEDTGKEGSVSKKTGVENKDENADTDGSQEECVVSDKPAVVVVVGQVCPALEVADSTKRGGSVEEEEEEEEEDNVIARKDDSSLVDNLTNTECVSEKRLTVENKNKKEEENKNIEEEENRNIEENKHVKENRNIEEENKSVEAESINVEEENRIVGEENRIVGEENRIVEEVNRIVEEENKSIEDENKIVEENINIGEDNRDVKEENKNIEEERNKNNKEDSVTPQKECLDNANETDDIEKRLTIYDFPSPASSSSPPKDSSTPQNIYRDQGSSTTPKKSLSIPRSSPAQINSSLPHKSHSIGGSVSIGGLRENKTPSSSPKLSKVGDICKLDSSVTYFSTKDVEITVVPKDGSSKKENEPQTPSKVQKSVTKEYMSPGSFVMNKDQQKHAKRKEGITIEKTVDRSPGNRQYLEKSVIKPQVPKAQDVIQDESISAKSIESSEQKETSIPDEPSDVAPSTAPVSSEVPSTTSTKSKEKVPRILKQLFQDEGVQNMLKSMGEESGAVPETSPNSDSGVHKLRPKRATEPMLSSSPELDAMEALLSCVTRKKKRGTELDTLYMDEGVLNLLTSLEPHSRRSHQDDAASDISQASSSRSVKTTKSTKSLDASSESRKRKLSGASTVSNASSKSMQPPDAKKMRPDSQEENLLDPYELGSTEESREQVVSCELNTGEADGNFAKKKGKPTLPLSVKQKNKAIRMQLKIQKQKQIKVAASDNSEGKEEEIINLAELQDTLKKTKEPQSEVPVQISPIEKEYSKSVPPLKIKLASDSVTIKPVARPPPFTQLAEVTVLAKSAKPPAKQSVSDIPGRPQARPSSTPPDPRVVVRTSMDKPRTLPERRTPPPQHRRIDTFGSTAPTGFTSLVRSFDVGGQAKSKQRIGGESVRQSQRASVRQSEGNYHYRDIALRKFNNFTQIILSPSTTKMKNALNSRVLRELCEALNILRRDETVKMVLLTGTGSTFCQGVDLTALQHPNIETRKKNAENLVRGIKDFLKALVQFPKPIIAGVNGNAMGLGVTMLPLFDMVIANDKAEFYLPYSILGQVPEGGATYTFPNLFGKLQSTKLFQGYKLTATMATELGLASETIWPATFQQQLIPRVALLATQSAQSMEATKALMNHHLVTKLELSLESECRVLLQQWTSPHFTHLCKKFLDSHHVHIHLQKPVNLPL